jgi:hypothetical protein
LLILKTDVFDLFYVGTYDKFCVWICDEMLKFRHSSMICSRNGCYAEEIVAMDQDRFHHIFRHKIYHMCQHKTGQTHLFLGLLKCHLKISYQANKACNITLYCNKSACIISYKKWQLQVICKIWLYMGKNNWSWDGEDLKISYQANKIFRQSLDL